MTQAEWDEYIVPFLDKYRYTPIYNAINLWSLIDPKLDWQHAPWTTLVLTFEAKTRIKLILRANLSATALQNYGPALVKMLEIRNKSSSEDAANIPL